MTASEPERFGKYLLLDLVAMGGMAELYRAKITGVEGFEKIIAIKKILPHLTNQEELVNAFVDEAKLAAHLQHENIIQIYDFGSMEDSYFISMEFLNGQDLQIILNAAKVNHCPISLELTCFIVARVCAGLHYAHNLKTPEGSPLNIIHRDINPQNIFLTREGQIKIIDFGIAKAAGRDITTKTGTIKGKAAYMSPEQADGRPIDHRSDIFATGIVLYEMLTGRKMFSGDTFEILSQVRKAAFTPVREATPGLPEKLYAILDKALQNKPEDRYQSCEEMQSDLEECLYSLKARPTNRVLSEYVNSLFRMPEKPLDLLGIEPTTIAEPGFPEIVITRAEETPENRIAAKNPPAAPKAKMIFNRFWGLLIFIFLVFLCMIYYFLGSRPNIPSNNPISQVAGEAPQPVNRFSIDRTEMETSLVRAAIHEKRFDDAISLCKSFMEQYPEHTQKMKPVYSEALYAKALHMAADQPIQAEKLLRQAVAADPKNAPAWFKQGLLLAKSDRFKDSQKSFQTAIGLNPNDADAYFNLGFACFKLGDLPQAEQMYTRTIELNPSFIDEAYVNLALVQEKLGKQDNYVHNLELALKANPNNPLARKLLDHNKSKGF